MSRTLLQLAFCSMISISAEAQEPAPVKPEAVQTTVTVTAAGGEVSTVAATAHGVVSAQQIEQLPPGSIGGGFTELLTRTTPGVAADSNGFAHPLGEHADTSISIDGQPITDQQAKVFANQLDPRIIQSLDAITGAPPAEFGGKTSLVVSVTTKSGLGSPLRGELSSEGGSFGTWSNGLLLSKGGARWGNFFAGSVAASDRFLDSPELVPMHDHGSAEGIFDRIDWHPRANDMLQWNLAVGRSRFQTPNSYDNEAAGQRQSSNITNRNLSMRWTHVFSPATLISVTPFLRQEEAAYKPTANPFADRPATLSQHRTLRNAGFRVEGLYSASRHTLKAGSTYWQTALHEQFSVGLTDPLYNSPCVDAYGSAVAAPGVASTANCANAGYEANDAFIARLLPYDLSRGGTQYRFDKSAGVEEAAMYAQDEMKLGDVMLSAGLRYDIYNGLSRGRQLQPRVGLAWKVAPLHTTMRGAYSRLYETPYNENLIFASEASSDTSAGNPFAAFRTEPLKPGTRNQFNVGLQSQVRRFTVDAEYYWKFTHTAFDFDTLFNTPITFSVALRKSKIDGLTIRLKMDELHGFSFSTVMGHVRSRFFTPQVGGVIFSDTPGSSVFRIDHGEEFEQTTELRYRAPKILGHLISTGFTWRYNSGLALPGTATTYLDALALTGNEQFQMGLRCAGREATPTNPIRNCSEADFSSERIRIPKLGTQDDDRNPVRVAPRTLLDVVISDDRAFKWDRVTAGFRISVVNLTNKSSLYNFLSTFSGTHFVAPRSVQAGMTLRF